MQDHLQHMQDCCNDWIQQSCELHAQFVAHTNCPIESSRYSVDWKIFESKRSSSSCSVSFSSKQLSIWKTSDTEFFRPKSTEESLEAHYVQGLIMCRQPDFYFLDSGPSLHLVSYLTHGELHLTQHSRGWWREIQGSTAFSSILEWDTRGSHQFRKMWSLVLTCLPSM